MQKHLARLRSVWRARHLGLPDVFASQWMQQRRMPELELGTFPDWLQMCRRTKHQIQRQKNEWKDKTVVCIGNGPSLNGMDLTCLDGCFAIGTNRAYALKDRFDAKRFHLVVQDNYRLREFGADLMDLTFPIHIGNLFYDEQWPIPTWLLEERENISFYMPRVTWKSEGRKLSPEADFSLGYSSDPSKYVNYGYSVIFSAIQFAEYFGASRIVCIGIDMDYSKGGNFVAGVNPVWDAFDYDTHCKPMFEYFRQYLQQRDVDLINATPGGKVDAIPRMDLQEALRKA